MANLLERRNMMMPLSDNWLDKQTIQTLLTAFGAGGSAVIKETNAYLNNIAGGDFNKAYMLAGFINEDPMMVCSLGLQPQGISMPIRWLVGDGQSWIGTSIIPTDNTIVETKIKVLNRITSHIVVFGSRDDVVEQFYISFAFHISDKIRLDFASTRLETANAVQDGVYSIEFGKTKAIINKVSYGTFSDNLGSGALPVYLMAGNNSGEPQYGTGLAAPMFKMKEGGTITHHFIPLLSATRNGMVDLVNATFNPNQGTGHFTDTYTFQDGETPWTPGT